MAEGFGGAIEAGKAFVEFLLDDKKFTGRLGQISQKLASVGKFGIKAMAPLIAMFSASVYVGTEFSAELEDMSARTGIAADELSRLTFIADTFNVSMEDVEHSVRKMQEQLADVGSGSAEFRKTVRDLGVDLDDLKRQSPDEQFVTLASAIGNLQEPYLRAYAAQKLFGKSGVEVLRVLKGGPDAFRRAAADAKRFGVVIGDDEVKANDELGTSIGIVKDQLRSLGTHISAAIAGPLTTLFRLLQNVLGGLNQFVTNHPRIVAAIAAIAGVVFTLATALYAVSTALKLIAATKALGTTATAVSTAFKIHPVLGGVALAAAGLGALYLWWKGKQDEKAEQAPGSLPEGISPDMMKQIRSTQPRVGGVITSPVGGAAASSSDGDPMSLSINNGSANDYLKQIADSNDDIRRYLRYSNQGFLAGVG